MLLSAPVLIGAGVLLVLWVTNLGLVVASFRSRGRRAVLLAAIALAISVLGVAFFKGRLEHKTTSTDMLPGGRTNVRTTGWHIDSRWFFAASGLISLPALVRSLRPGRRHSTAWE